MAWYNIKKWFTRDKGSSANAVLYCDNPQCKKPILDDEVAFNESHAEIYHPNDLCPQLAAAHKVLASGEAISACVEYVSREKALRLFSARKLVQSKRLEDKL